MPAFDAAALAALGGEAIRPAFYCFLDILGDPLAATTAGHDETITGSGDPELDGRTFLGVDPTVVAVGEVVLQESGSDTLSVSLSGQLLPDNDLLTTIGDPANWRGRVARLWVRIRDGDGNAAGQIAPYYTGYMMALDIVPGSDAQTIELRIENYLALLTRPSGRTYLDQARYDPADTSARATIGAANGGRGAAGAAVSAGGAVGAGVPTLADRALAQLR